MFSYSNHIRSLLFALAGSISLPTLQSAWAYHAYPAERRQMMNHVGVAFDSAYQKEQTRRIDW